MQLQKKDLTPAITRVQLEAPMFSLSGSRRENPALLVIFAENLANNPTVDHSSFRRQQSAGGDTYFERVAAVLGVTYESNWAGCLVSAMTKSCSDKHNPFLFLDEFNEGTKRDLQDLNLFYASLPTAGILFDHNHFKNNNC